MNKRRVEIKFAHFLDRALKISTAGQLPWQELDHEFLELQAVITQLDEAELAAEQPTPTALKKKWTAAMMKDQPEFRAQKVSLRWVKILVPILVLLAVLVLAFCQPLQTVLANLLGYGYIEENGFFRLDSTNVLSGPVMQEHAGESLTVLTGLTDAGSTRLWLKANDPALDLAGAWLETADGTKLPAKYWQRFADSTHADEFWLSFDPLAGKQMTATLIFPEGWHLPLQFISGVEWQQRVKTVQPSISIPFETPTVLTPCHSVQGFDICVQDTAYASDGLKVLLDSDAGKSIFTPISAEMFLGLIAANPFDQNDQAVLEVGSRQTAINIAPLPAESIVQQGDGIVQTLTFPQETPISGTAKLTIPAFVAKLALPQPVNITVDLGPNPQAGQSVPLPADIQISGHTVHFDSATIEGDGVNSLRLTLTSAPIEAQDGWLVGLLELGKPEGIADRYGAGSINADRRLKVFTELFGDDGKITTGTLNLPVIDAMVVFPGPFEFTFALPEANANPVQFTPTVVSGDTFSPAPTPTPLDLASYTYNHVALQPNDLLFTVVHDTTTDLYAQSAQSGATPQLVATLPGQVYQVYVQPDQQGIDYLAGSLVTEKNMAPYFKNAQLFSLRFDETGPRLLAVFPTGPSALQGGGSQVSSTSWSADGGIFAFILAGLQDSKGQYEQKAGWIDLNCRKSGNCMLQYVNLPATVEDFYSQQFSPLGRTLLYEGTISSPTHGDVEKLYQVTFDAAGQPGEITPVTQLDAAMEDNPRWLPDSNSLLLNCTDMDNNTDVNNNHLCEWNLKTDQRTDLLDLNQYVSNPIMRSFELSPKGDLLTEGSRVGIQLFNRETRKFNLLPFSENLSGLVFDAQEQNLYLLGEKGTSIQAVDLGSMTERTVYRQSSEGYVAWIGTVAEP